LTENPNSTPIFIRQGGLVGRPVSLTNQVCTRDAPGNVPLVLYDNSDTAGYASGNGALVEDLIIAPTGTVIKSTLLIFWKINNQTSAPWLYWDEVDLPAQATISASAKSTTYPFRATLTRTLLSPTPRVGTIQYASGFRINGDSVPIQIGVALGIAAGTAPVIVWLDGGEY
jgi:hypothetical protein